MCEIRSGVDISAWTYCGLESSAILDESGKIVLWKHPSRKVSELTVFNKDRLGKYGVYATVSSGEIRVVEPGGIEWIYLNGSLRTISMFGQGELVVESDGELIETVALHGEVLLQVVYEQEGVSGFLLPSLGLSYKFLKDDGNRLFSVLRNDYEVVGMGYDERGLLSLFRDDSGEYVLKWKECDDAGRGDRREPHNVYLCSDGVYDYGYRVGKCGIVVSVYGCSVDCVPFELVYNPFLRKKLDSGICL